MKRTEKSKANSKQKSKASSRQDKNKANGRQSEPKDCEPRQDDLRGEAQYRGKLQPASFEASKNRCRCPAGVMRAEAWRNDRDHPKDRFRRGNRGVQENPPDSSAQKQRHRKSRRP